MRNNSHGRDEKERLEDGVGLGVEFLDVCEQPCATGREQRACLLLSEELGRADDDTGDEGEDEEAHLLVALEAGEGLVLALGGSRRPAMKK